MRYLPTLLTIATLLAGCAKKDAAEPELQAAARKTRAVKITPVIKRSFEDRIEAQGSLEAKVFAAVSAKIDANLDQILVDEGDTVVKDETVLFISDTRKPLQHKQSAEQTMLVAAENHQVALANVAKAEAQCDKARKDRDRYANLFAKGNVTINEKELYDTKFIVADADLKLARAQAQAAAAQHKQAQVAFDIASKDLDDCTIKAPISGVVTKRLREPGEHASPSTTVLRLEATDTLEVSALFPGKYFPRVTAGKTTVRVIAEGQDAGSLPVTFRADAIDTTLRTFEIKALLKNDKRAYASGMMTNVTLIMDQRQNLGIPSHCLIERQQGCVCFLKNDDNTARELIVTPGLANDGFTEILACKTRNANGELADFTLTEGMPIILEGQYLLINGDPISVREH